MTPMVTYICTGTLAESDYLLFLRPWIMSPGHHSYTCTARNVIENTVYEISETIYFEGKFINVSLV